METISEMLGGLTDHDLREWAGGKICQRGRAIVDRVEGLRRTADNELVAWVRGTRRYATLVHLDEGGEHEWLCTCPSEWGPCKHAVAVVLTAARAVGRGEEIPLLTRQDHLARTLFDGQAAPADDDDLSGAGDDDRRPDETALRGLLEAKSREELRDLLLTLPGMPSGPLW